MQIKIHFGTAATMERPDMKGRRHPRGVSRGIDLRGKREVGAQSRLEAGLRCDGSWPPDDGRSGLRSGRPGVKYGLHRTVTLLRHFGPKQNRQSRRWHLPDVAGRSCRARIQPVCPRGRRRRGSRRPPPGCRRGSTEWTGRREGASESCRRLPVPRVESAKGAGPLKAVLVSPDHGGLGFAITLSPESENGSSSNPSGSAARFLRDVPALARSIRSSTSHRP
jgi:hypothetical protein